MQQATLQFIPYLSQNKTVSCSILLIVMTLLIVSNITL